MSDIPNGDIPNGDMPTGDLPAETRHTAAMVEVGDLDGLLRRIDELSGTGSWDELFHLRDLCRGLPRQGKPLWPAAVNAEYRLALEGDAPAAARAVMETDGRFALGPLPEVAASSHTWAQLAPHLPAGPLRALVAYERVLRGEDLSGDRSIDTSVFDLPLRLQPWEGTYPLATYEPWRGIFPTPAVHELHPVRVLPESGRPTADLTATEALAELTRPWTTESNGRAEEAMVEGDHLDAIAALGVESVRVARITAAGALELLAWTAASGGAHGRRRGMAAGRFNAWWVVASLSGLADEWPVDPDDIGDAVDALEWFAWDLDAAPSAWSFRIAAVDPVAGVAWAAMADDRRTDP